MVHKSPLQLLITILLVFSFVISSVAVPASRSFLSSREEFSRLSSAQATPVQGLVDLRNGEEMVEMGEEMIEGRMVLESTDYPGTGANNRHDPRTPGRA